MNLAAGLTLLCLLPLWLVPGPVRKHLLLVATLVFWALMSPIGLAWMLGMAFLAWIVSAESRRGAAHAVIALMIAVLLTFKAGTMLRPADGWLLPLGMSYYLFRCISYVLDVKWQTTRRLPFNDLLLYAAFFPAALAGPVDRAGTFTEQVRGLEPKAWDHKEIRYGLFLILAGLLAKLVISSRLEGLADGAYARPDARGVLSAAVAVAAFPWQLYYDFGGYTLMALGMGRLLGIHLPQNFNKPFLAPTVTEFWNRWHMSMSGWFRDYVYTPIRFRLRRHRTASVWIASLTSFTLVGIWHGAGMGFVILGLIHGTAVGVETFLHRRGARATVPAILRTYLIVAFSLVLFRAPDLRHAGQVLAEFSRWRGGDLQAILDAVNKLDFGVLLVTMPAFSWITSRGWLDTNQGADLLETVPQPLRWLVYTAMISFVLVLAVHKHAPFIYAQF